MREIYEKLFKKLFWSTIIIFTITHTLWAEPIRIMMLGDSINVESELIQGGGNDNGALSVSEWTAIGNTVGLSVSSCNGAPCLSLSPTVANGGAYQVIQTEVGETYTLTAMLLGSNHYTDITNYTFGNSYVTVEDGIPLEGSNPTHTSQKVIGSTATEVVIEFTATSAASYVSLRGDAAYRYPKALSISVKKTGGVTPPVDDGVKSINGPAIIARGQSVTLTVDYVASQSRTLAVYLKATTGTKNEYFYKRVNAEEGDKIKQVTFTVPANAPINATYKYGTYIAAKGKYFSDNLGKAYQHGVKFQTNYDIVKSINGPAIIARGQSVTLTVDYVASQRRTLAVYLKATTGTKNEYFYKRVNAEEGDKIKQVTFTVPANAPINATYKYGTYIAAKGKYFSDNLGKAYQHGVKVVSMDSGLPWNHGNLEVTSDGRMLQHADGTGLFWMADTAWSLYRKTRDDIDLYMSNRAEKKYTVIQAVALYSHKSSSNGERPFIDEDISQPNEAYWEHIDYMIGKAEEYGMYVALLPTWHSAVEFRTFRTPADATLFGEWIANRYKNRPNIIWVPGGDTPIDGSRVPAGMTAAEEVAIWNALGSAIDRIDSNHLITFHPLRTIPSVQLGNPSWLDFNMLQSGREPTSNSIRQLETAMREGLAVVDGESLYEGLAYGGRGKIDRRTAFQVRDDAYSQLFAGAFGNTYGHDAIYKFWESTAPVECSAWICTPSMTWREAINAPGGVQMQYVTELMQSRPIVGRLPDQSLISSTPSSQSGIVATLGNGYAMIYSARGESFTIEMGKVTGTEVKTWWYNPRDGVSTFIGEFDNSGTQTFNPPGEPRGELDQWGMMRDGNDWVLVLDDNSKGFTIPGQ